MTTGSNSLSTFIRNDIEQSGGRISFARFMQLALYHPEGGYYLSPHFDLGKDGDFTTASEISPLFARSFSRPCQQVFQIIQEEANLLELGAGTGRFAGELLLTLEKHAALPERYYIHEISPHLQNMQQTILAADYPSIFSRVQWIDKLPTHFKGVIIANEVLDALPVSCFHISQDIIKERTVTWENNQFAWALSAPLSDEFDAKVQQLRQQYHLDDGYESEINLQLPLFIQRLAHCLDQGIILFSDYGYGQREYYHPERRHGTLTCFHQHHHHDNPLILPGSQDITAHVDFTRVIDTAIDHGLTLGGYTTQAAFLLNCGLMTLAEEQEKNLSPVDTFNMHQAIKRLTMPTEMGELVKIMALVKNIELPLLGFQSHDRRREL